MFKTVEIIRARYWEHARTGRRASIYGAAPCWGEPEAHGWRIVERGYTWRCTDAHGRETIGACRAPAKTLEDAEKIRALLLA